MRPTLVSPHKLTTSIMRASVALATLAFGVSQVAAHGGVLSYNIGGQDYNGYVEHISRRSLRLT